MAVRLKQPAWAARLLGAAALRDSTGKPMASAHRAINERVIGETRTLLDDATFETAWAAGYSLTLEEAASEAGAISGATG